MRRPILLIGTVALALSLSLSAHPQSSCGDANENGVVNILDIVYIMSYLREPHLGAPTPGPLGDCDDRSGFTIGDMSALVRYIFYGENPLDCNIQSTYTFPPSLTDTVFLPRMTDIPAELDSILLPIVTSFAADTRAFYIPCWYGTTTGPGEFAFRRVVRNVECGISSAGGCSDTVVFTGCELANQTLLRGRNAFFSLVMNRTLDGTADVQVRSAARSEIWRVSVQKGDDLYAPVIRYYEVPVPTPVVTVLPSSIDMAAEAGYWSTETYPVTFASDAETVSFNVAASDSWIVIEDPSTTGYTTPATITVRVDATELLAGTYTGQITFSDINPSDAVFEPAVLDITLTVTEPLIYPPGDINCDGRVSIGDVMLLIDCLFINPRQVPTCE